VLYSIFDYSMIEAVEHRINFKYLPAWYFCKINHINS